ncbi:MAG: hypothetical protein KF760_19605 [Candidatus Eremiobacteraeota bacterium]|nr:hypothetical protein [Candidatus Eremiobacteraeota bacterium]MCW5868778.1 hypothetical protein [Candidatus Eremiobacteraeota bacterium]
MRISQLSPLRLQTIARTTRAVEKPELPGDAMEISAQDKGPSKRWVGALALGGMSVACMLLSGCGHQLSPEQLGATLPVQTAAQDGQQALRFEVIPNAMGKVDIIRQTHTESVPDSDGKGSHSETVKDDLQPVGVYLGNGLYLDAGLNVSLVPDRVLHQPIIPQDFRQINIQGQLGSWSRNTITQNGNQVSIRSPLSFTSTVTRDSENKTTLQLGTFSPFQKFNRIEITREGNQTVIQGWAPHGLEAMNRIEITQSGNVTNVHPWGMRGLVDTRITREADKITVQRFGGSLGRTDIQLNPNGEQKISEPWSLGSQTIARGENGLNYSERGLGTTHSSILSQGNDFLVREPGILSTTTITVQK